MHNDNLRQCSAVRFREHEADRLQIDDLDTRSRFEVQSGTYGVRLLELGLFVPVELDDLGVKHLTIVKFHPLATKF